MNDRPPRLRMFAGPNGSGKSTLKYNLRPELLGTYLNPDEIEVEIRNQGFLDLAQYGVRAASDETLSFFKQSDFLRRAGLEASTRQFYFKNARLYLGIGGINSYVASAIADFLRQKLLAKKTSFTFETVMSHPGKIHLLHQARRQGYRTYLYFVATDDPAINISRVKNRVKMGGHAVPEDRIRTRYHRSLNLLMEAIRGSDRAYIFDNSGENPDRKHTWIAEITAGNNLELKSKTIPDWFKLAVLDKIASPE